MSDTCDVAIIGAGPVGLSLANLLGKFGRKVILLEREAHGYSLPRAVTFDDEIMRLFQAIGLEDEIGAITEVGSDSQFLDGDGNVLVRWERPQEITPNGWYVNYRFHQPTLERVLRDALGRFASVETRFNAEVVDLQSNSDGVDVTLADGSSLTAAYVVGCDGGRSFTRKWLGGGSEDLGFHEPWLIVDLVLPEPEEDPDRKTTHYCGTARMGSKVYVGRDRKRWEFRLNEEDDPETVGTHEVAWDILKDWISPQEAEIERTAVYTFHSVLARNWGQDRVFIAGDAAHQTPPFMGQGMCAGIRDAANLAWKLDFALSDLGPDGLLATYQSERLTHARTLIELTMNMGRLINATASGITPEVADGEDGSQRMRLIRPVLGPGLEAGQTARRGELFAQVTLSDGRRLDDVQGMAFGLLAATISDEDRSAFEAAGIRVITDPALTEELAGSSAVLVRPDRAVMGEAQGDLSTLLPENWKVA